MLLLVSSVSGVVVWWMMRRRERRLMRQLREAEARVNAATALESEAFAGLVCPISRTLMVDPVVAGDGKTYERSEFERYAGGRARVVSPWTRESIGSAVVANTAVRGLVEVLVRSRAFGLRFSPAERAEYWTAEGERCADADAARAARCFRRARSIRGAEGDAGLRAARARATARLGWCAVQLGDAASGAALYEEASVLGDPTARADRDAAEALRLCDGLLERGGAEHRGAAAAVARVALSLVDGRDGRLAVAARERATRALRELLPRKRDEAAQRRLIAAAIAGRATEVRAALAEADVNAPGDSGATALIAAADYGRADVAAVLLAEPGIRVNEADASGETALIKASRDTTPAGLEIVNALLRREDCRVNHANADGRHALTCATIEGADRVVARILADPRVDPNWPDCCGETALVWAIDMGWLGIVSLLIADARVDLDAATRAGDTPLMRASSFCTGDPRIVQALVDADRNAEVVRLLLGAGCDPNKADAQGSTPLLWAAYKSHRAVVDVLLGAPTTDANIQDSEGDTALIVACSEGDASVVARLLKMDVDIFHENQAGLTAMDCAKNEGHDNCFRLLAAEARRRTTPRLI
ncbi:hypothetical protein CTAYLR_001074 [Chrysophaeum taylorii]|uniref:U-box domain-containing protein n=1 Tax=Chrysophaeum taylorii TaxID=2483200 RepID=A0AAD7UI17_9STRA|nr:hypothetical protein CTAYLR_001074 [Chrysophaeum taylorii]